MIKQTIAALLLSTGIASAATLEIARQQEIWWAEQQRQIDEERFATTRHGHLPGETGNQRYDRLYAEIMDYYTTPERHRTIERVLVEEDHPRLQELAGEARFQRIYRECVKGVSEDRARQIRESVNTTYSGYAELTYYQRGSITRTCR